eukprot:g3169.t1
MDDLPTTPLTKLARRRLKVPTLNLSANPFRQSTQLADQQELLDLNKNDIERLRKPDRVPRTYLKHSKIHSASPRSDFGIYTQPLTKRNIARAAEKMRQSLVVTIRNPTGDVVDRSSIHRRGTTVRKSNSRIGHRLIRTTDKLKTVLSETQAIFGDGGGSKPPGTTIRYTGTQRTNGGGRSALNRNKKKKMSKSYSDFFLQGSKARSNYNDGSLLKGEVRGPVSFGHRPSSASRHFDPLSMTIHRFPVNKRKLPRAGTLSTIDLALLLRGNNDHNRIGRTKAYHHHHHSLRNFPNSSGSSLVQQQAFLQEQPSMWNVSDLGDSLTDVAAIPSVETAGMTSVENNIGDNNSLAPVMGSESYATMPNFPMSSSSSFAGDTPHFLLDRASGKMEMSKLNTSQIIHGPSWLGGSFEVGTGKSMFCLDNETTEEKKSNGSSNIYLRSKKKYSHTKIPIRGAKTITTTVDHPKDWTHVKANPQNRSLTGLTDVRDRTIQNQFRKRNDLTHFEKKQKYIRLAGGTRMEGESFSAETRSFGNTESDINRSYQNIKDLHRSRYTDGDRFYFKNSVVHSATPRGFKHDLNSVVQEVELRERLATLEQENNGDSDTLDDK